MANLRKGMQSITVPDDAASDYIKQGWADASVALVQPAPAKKASRKRSPKPPKPAATPVEVEGDPSETEDAD